MGAEDRTAVLVRIQGRVQGVSFRAWTIAAAGTHRLDGWVRNRRDGSVEALMAGAPGDVEAMVARCRSGPLQARVSAVERGIPVPDEVPWGDGFHVRPTV